jgi:2-polyprenyl-6-methoxyphenol hydroxylase-like FAD-dependent oxidoreductase
MYDILKDALLRDSHNIAYETGRLVRNIEFVNQQVTVVYQNLENGQIERMSADLIIGADGAYSTVRKLVSGENSCLKYSGYVTWRGRVSENRLSRKTFEHLHYQAPTLRTEGGYILW